MSAIPETAERIGPGVYIDPERILHVAVDELCAHFGVPMSDGNVKAIVRALFSTADDLDVPLVFA